MACRNNGHHSSINCLQCACLPSETIKASSSLNKYRFITKKCLVGEEESSFNYCFRHIEDLIETHDDFFLQATIPGARKTTLK